MFVFRMRSWLTERNKACGEIGRMRDREEWALGTKGLGSQLEGSMRE